MRRIDVVGASLAGFRAAEALRERGFDGDLHLVGDEPYAPYNRPPLSKALLTGRDSPDTCSLQAACELDAVWHLDRRAEGLDGRARRVVLDRGQQLTYDGLVIATGARARRWPAGAVPEGVLTLRRLDDALALRAELQRGAKRLLVVGAGFVGGEVASSAASLGVPVTLVELEQAPLLRALGPEVGRFLAHQHRAHGVDVHLGVTIERFLAGAGRLRGALLSDGTIVEADVCVLALGAEPNAEWLRGTGAAIDRGIACDDHLRVAGLSNAVAAGDVVRWPHPLFDGERISVGHWTNALEQGSAAARNLLATPDEREPFASVPTFWSEQHGTKLRSAGLPAIASASYMLEGRIEDGRFLVGYERRGTIVGALAVNMNRRMPIYRRLVAERATMGDAIQTAATSVSPRRAVT